MISTKPNVATFVDEMLVELGGISSTRAAAKNALVNKKFEEVASIYFSNIDDPYLGAIYALAQLYESEAQFRFPLRVACVSAAEYAKEAAQSRIGNFISEVMGDERHWSVESVNEVAEEILAVLGKPDNHNQQNALEAFRRGDPATVKRLSSGSLGDSFLRCLGYLVGAVKLAATPTPNIDTILAEAGRSASDHVRDRKMLEVSRIVAKHFA